MITKLVVATISPLGTSLLLGILAIILAKFQRPRLGFYIGFFAILWLWAWSTPLASHALRGWIEDRAGPRTIAELPNASVAVVLGGGISGPRFPERPVPDLNSASDRLWHAARLYHAEKAETLVLSGGVVDTGDGSEAEAMRRFLVDLGVPSAAMILEPGSTSTASNARAVSTLLGEQGTDQVMLVTSALHMPRAAKLFQKAGLAVIQAPTDFEVIPTSFGFFRFIPNSDSLNGSARAIKELVGWMVAGFFG